MYTNIRFRRAGKAPHMQEERQPAQKPRQNLRMKIYTFSLSKLNQTLKQNQTPYYKQTGQTPSMLFRRRLPNLPLTLKQLL